MFRFCRTVNWVAQSDPMGCSVAVLAMILGRTYGSVKADFVNERDFVTRGLNFHDVDDYLSCHGIAVARRWFYRLVAERKDWPPAPFAELHLCNVVVSPTSQQAHFVLMTADGSVLDPLTPERKRLTDYHKVNNVAAIVWESTPTSE